ncbi:hypothetical protein O6H91_20G008300 [Diphasiastrum complanatum]|uniref:Uncharacterized protein n=2 Tax=Diphasiastrum complanatum TaxID=34168 RepID=A0ACC2AMW5_DIPCM|nr:hypothetical protein O6H91_20G008000 [Diphasiastrum complanatum]KAJ7518780.1 hypothetical protein O6H91_20G008300 [Diphasiastrum complanatum]
MAISWGVKSFPFTICVHILGVVAAVLDVTKRSRAYYEYYQFATAILVYKSIPGSKEYKKLVHLSLQGVTLVVAIVAILAVFKFHNENGIDNLYSLHSWLGLTTVILFALQWLIGFVTFWYPGATENTRSALKPWHIFFGLLTYGLTIAMAESGTQEKLTFLQITSVIGRYSSEALIANSLGVTLVLLGAFVFLAVVVSSR